MLHWRTTFGEQSLDLDAWLRLDIGKTGLFKTQGEKQGLHYFKIRKDTSRYWLCIDHHFAVAGYTDKSVFPGEKRWLHWENWLPKVVKLALLACLGSQMLRSTRNKLIAVLYPRGVIISCELIYFFFNCS